MDCIVSVVSKSQTQLSNFHFHKCSCLENSMDMVDYIVHGLAKNRTRLSDFHFTSLTVHK